MRCSAAIGVGVVLLSTPLVAQTSRPFQFGIGGGMTFVTGEDRDFYKDGFNVQGTVSVDVPSLQIAARFDLMYHRLAGKEAAVGDSLVLGDFSVLAGALSAVYAFSPGASVRPFVSGGFGVYRSEAEAVLYGNPVSGSATDFGIVGGFGLQFTAGRVRPYVEARVHNIFGDGGSEQLYPITVGVFF